MSINTHIHEMYGTLRKTSFCTKRYAEIHIQRPFFDNKKGTCKILVLKVQKCAHALVPLLHKEVFVFEKHQNLNFWWYFQKFLELIVFGQILVVLAILGSFR